jgi:predicted short-subunit dehydrogenase-like oxidoreductase (DUF2520 family)
MGRALAGGLSEAGEAVVLWSRREAAGAVGEAVTGASTVLLAVSDDAITEVAGQLAAAGTVGSDHVVLHLSASGAALGSFHPLQSVAEADLSARRWQGAYASVEGDERAVREAERLAARLGLVAVRISGPAKPGYHAGAVFAANYVVALLAVASRLAREAGIPPELAGKIYLPLLESAVENLSRLPPEQALTGPVRRGDSATVRAHLEALGPEDRVLYARLGLEALALARAAGLEPASGDAMERMLRDY